MLKPHLIFNVLFAVGLLNSCSGFPVDLRTQDGSAGVWAAPLLSVAVLGAAVLLLVGCACCRHNKGFQEFTDSASSHSLAGVGAGAANPAATTPAGYAGGGELTMFPPADRASVVRFEPLPDMGAAKPPSRKPASFNNVVSGGLSAGDWLEDPHANFPRHQLKYLRELGRGWFGRVVEGEAQSIVPGEKNTKVVVKILREDATPTDQMYFLHEVRYHRDLNHKNILRLLGRCLEKDPFLLLLESCSGGDLKTFLMQNEATADVFNKQGVTLQMACNIATGLHHMHSKGFVHTDLAARNCLVTPDMTVKIGDYGTSIENFKDDYYCAGDVALPIRWCAPETLHCTETTIETKEVTPTANVWNLGVVLWEICEFGKLPYAELTDDEVIIKVLGEGSHRLPLPSHDSPYRNNLYLLMKLCWAPVSQRPALDQVVCMLNHIQANYEQHIGGDCSLQTDEDFERRWESFKPNTIPKTDNHTLLKHYQQMTVPVSLLDNKPFLLPRQSAEGSEAISLSVVAPEINSSSPITTSPQLSLTSSSGGEFFTPNLLPKHKSASLQDLHGSVENLCETSIDERSDSYVMTDPSVADQLAESVSLNEAVSEIESRNDNPENIISGHDFDSWLQGVETSNEEDVKFVMKISEAIRDLDNALAQEKTSSSSSEVSSNTISHHQSPAKDFETGDQNVVLDFRLGVSTEENKNRMDISDIQLDSFQEDSFPYKAEQHENKTGDSGTDTEDETWRKRIERGEFSEKVKEKSKSVADLMVLTHIECSDGSDSEPPSLTWNFERTTTGRNSLSRQRRGSTSKSLGVPIAGSESNIHQAVLGEEFFNTLVKLREAQKDENKNRLRINSLSSHNSDVNLTPSPTYDPLLQRSSPFSDDSATEVQSLLSSKHYNKNNFLVNDASEITSKCKDNKMNIKQKTKMVENDEHLTNNENKAEVGTPSKQVNTCNVIPNNKSASSVRNSQELDDIKNSTDSFIQVEKLHSCLVKNSSTFSDECPRKLGCDSSNLDGLLSLKDEKLLQNDNVELNLVNNEPRSLNLHDSISKINNIEASVLFKEDPPENIEIPRETDSENIVAMSNDVTSVNSRLTSSHSNTTELSHLTSIHSSSSECDMGDVISGVHNICRTADETVLDLTESVDNVESDNRKDKNTEIIDPTSLVETDNNIKREIYQENIIKSPDSEDKSGHNLLINEKLTIPSAKNSDDFSSSVILGASEEFTLDYFKGLSTVLRDDNTPDIDHCPHSHEISSSIPNLDVSDPFIIKVPNNITESSNDNIGFSDNFLKKSPGAYNENNAIFHVELGDTVEDSEPVSSNGLVSASLEHMEYSSKGTIYLKPNESKIPPVMNEKVKGPETDLNTSTAPNSSHIDNDDNIANRSEGEKEFKKVTMGDKNNIILSDQTDMITGLAQRNKDEETHLITTNTSFEHSDHLIDNHKLGMKSIFDNFDLDVPEKFTKIITQTPLNENKQLDDPKVCSLKIISNSSMKNVEKSGENDIVNELKNDTAEDFANSGSSLEFGIVNNNSVNVPYCHAIKDSKLTETADQSLNDMYKNKECNLCQPHIQNGTFNERPSSNDENKNQKDDIAGSTFYGSGKMPPIVNNTTQPRHEIITGVNSQNFVPDTKTITYSFTNLPHENKIKSPFQITDISETQNTDELLDDNFYLNKVTSYKETSENIDSSNGFTVADLPDHKSVGTESLCTAASEPSRSSNIRREEYCNEFHKNEKSEAYTGIMDLFSASDYKLDSNEKQNINTNSSSCLSQSGNVESDNLNCELHIPSLKLISPTPVSSEQTTPESSIMENSYIPQIVNRAQTMEEIEDDVYEEDKIDKHELFQRKHTSAAKHEEMMSSFSDSNIDLKSTLSEFISKEIIYSSLEKSCLLATKQALLPLVEFSKTDIFVPHNKDICSVNDIHLLENEGVNSTSVSHLNDTIMEELNACHKIKGTNFNELGQTLLTKLEVESNSTLQLLGDGVNEKVEMCLTSKQLSCLDSGEDSCPETSPHKVEKWNHQHKAGDELLHVTLDDKVYDHNRKLHEYQVRFNQDVTVELDDELGLDVVKHSTPDDERSSDSGFRDKGSLSESCEDACDEKYNLEDIEAELEETFNKGGFNYSVKGEECDEDAEHRSTALDFPEDSFSLACNEEGNGIEFSKTHEGYDSEQMLKFDGGGTVTNENCPSLTSFVSHVGIFNTELPLGNVKHDNSVYGNESYQFSDDFVDFDDSLMQNECKSRSQVRECWAEENVNADKSSVMQENMSVDTNCVAQGEDCCKGVCVDIVKGEEITDTVYAGEVSENIQTSLEDMSLLRDANVSLSENNGWFLHDQNYKVLKNDEVVYKYGDNVNSGEENLSPGSTSSDSLKNDDSNGSDKYVPLSLDEEFVAAIRNELRDKLPCAQQQTQPEELEDFDDEFQREEERTDITIHYNVYPAPLSPILEERESISSLTATISENYPLPTSSSKGKLKDDSDSEPGSPVFMLDSVGESSDYCEELDRKRFEEEIRQALANCSVSSVDTDSDQPKSSAVCEDLEDDYHDPDCISSTSKIFTPVKTNQQDEYDDDFLVVNTETNEATLLESPKPKSYTACMKEFDEANAHTSVPSAVYNALTNGRTEFNRDIASDDEVFTPDSISPVGDEIGSPISTFQKQNSCSTQLKFTFESPICYDSRKDEETNLCLHSAAAQGKSCDTCENKPVDLTKSDIMNTVVEKEDPGVQNNKVYDNFMQELSVEQNFEKVETDAFSADESTDDKSEHLSEAENKTTEDNSKSESYSEVLSEPITLVTHQAIVENTLKRHQCYEDLSTGFSQDSELATQAREEITGENQCKDSTFSGRETESCLQGLQDDQIVITCAENCEVKDSREHTELINSLKILADQERITNDFLEKDVYSDKNEENKLEAEDDCVSEEINENGPTLNDTLKLYRKRKEAELTVTGECEWLNAGHEASVLSTKAPMPSPEEESWKQLPSMLAFSADLNSAEDKDSDYSAMPTAMTDDLMSTSFSLKEDDFGDCYTPDWESGSEETNEEDNSSSSGEFIWKAYEGLTDFPMEVIEEEEEDDDADDDEDSSSSGSGAEFVPSAWNSEATPNRSALRSPDKRSEQKKNVSFKKQKYHCVYEYPKEVSDSDSEGIDSPSRKRWDVYQPPNVDYASYADWDLVLEGDIPEAMSHDMDAEPDIKKGVAVEPFDFYKLSSVEYDFPSGAEDREFLISSTSRPFHFNQSNPDPIAGSNISQFFPGKDSSSVTVINSDNKSEEELTTSPVCAEVPDHTEEIKNADCVLGTSPQRSGQSVSVSGIPSKLELKNVPYNSPKVDFMDKLVTESQSMRHKPSVPSPTERVARLDERDSPPELLSPSSPMSPSGLGELRHTRDRLKLDLPPSGSPFLLDPPSGGKRRSLVEAVKGEASLLDSGEDTEDSGIESSNGHRGVDAVEGSGHT